MIRATIGPSAVVAAVSCSWLVSSADAQVGPDADLIRRQIQALQQQLNALESTPAAGKVTQLGGARLRTRQPELVVRIYDLSDLFTIAPSYPAQIGGQFGLERRLVFAAPAGNYSGFGGFGGGVFSVPSVGKSVPGDVLGQFGLEMQGGDVAAAARISLDGLLQSIQQTISPEIWSDAGGPAVISKLGTSLIITADESAHDQIDSLLKLLRQRWGTLRTVSVRAWWLWLGDRQLELLLPGDGKGAVGNGELTAFGAVDHEAWQALLAQTAQADDQRWSGYRAVLTSYNGQTVHAISGEEALAVTQVRPVIVKGDDDKPAGRIAYRPDVQALHAGAVLQVTPLVNTSGRFVILDLHSQVSIADPAGTAGVVDVPLGDEPEPADVVSALDRPSLLTQRLSTTLRLPVDRVMLVGGMTFSGEPHPQQAALYLFVRLAVQELRDDFDEASAAAPAKGKATGGAEEDSQAEPSENEALVPDVEPVKSDPQTKQRRRKRRRTRD